MGRCLGLKTIRESFIQDAVAAGLQSCEIDLNRLGPIPFCYHGFPALSSLQHNQVVNGGRGAGWHMSQLRDPSRASW